MWEDEGDLISQPYTIVLWHKIIDEAEQAYLKAAKLGENPSYESREPDLPIGLKVNL